MNTFKAFRIHETDGKIAARFEDLTLDALTPGEVVIEVQYSDINYKDALAATGAGKILRRYPLVGGIDLAGVVKTSEDPRFKPGDAVLVTGSGLSETVDGGYAELARVKGDSVIPMPPGLDAFRAMALGTAGFTAALAIHRMERNGQAPARGPIVVTGATGGVGSVAIDMLAGRGYEVIAVTGKPESAEYLKSLGARKVVLRGDLRARQQAARARALRRRHRQRRRRHARGPHAAGRFLGKYRKRRARGRRRAQHHGHAVHPARRQPARHQFVGHAPRRAAGGVEAHRERLRAAPPRTHRDAARFRSRSCRARSRPTSTGKSPAAPW